MSGQTEKTDDLKGLVWNIQRFNLHDGCGIRTLIFFKGCPLRCLWCANPEGQAGEPEVQHIVNKCMKCGLCAGVCPASAIKIGEFGPIIDDQSCDVCGKCGDICPTCALSIVGKRMTVLEILDEVRKDTAFYRRSGGGLTITGGEPAAQPEFARSLLAKAHYYGINTSMETCGHAPWGNLRRILEYCNTVLYDIKHMDPKTHKDLTGVENSLILDNARKIAKLGMDIVFRMPIIPGYNDQVENICATAEFAKKIGVRQMDLLPYHRLGEGKYQFLGKQYPLPAIDPPSDERMAEIKRIAEEAGGSLLVKIGG